MFLCAKCMFVSSLSWGVYSNILLIFLLGCLSFGYCDMSSFPIFDSKLLSGVGCVNIFSHSVENVFSLCSYFLCWTKAFQFYLESVYLSLILLASGEHFTYVIIYVLYLIFSYQFHLDCISDVVLESSSVSWFYMQYNTGNILFSLLVSLGFFVSN